MRARGCVNELLILFFSVPFCDIFYCIPSISKYRYLSTTALALNQAGSFAN